MEFLNASGSWIVTEGVRPVAVLMMDRVAQLDEVLLCPGIREKERLTIVRLAASHVMRYVVRRQTGDVLLLATYTGRADLGRSAELLQDGVVPDEVAALTEAQLTKKLRSMGIDIIVGEALTIGPAINAVLGDPKLKDVSFTVGENLYGSLHPVTFKVKGKQSFCGWHDVDQPGGAMDLYIIPSYHPCMVKGKEGARSVNGSTDALIRGEAVNAIHAPKGSHASNRSYGFGSWSHMKHPFYAEGKEIVLDISATKVLSAEGMAELKQVLFALLGVNSTYLRVIGGFNGPYSYPESVARSAGIRTSAWQGKVRGSEGYCVWAYEVLEKEGKLKGAHVPEWFTEEGWLEAYKRYGRRK